MLLPLNNDRVPSSLPSYDQFKPYESISLYLGLIEKSVATIQQKYLSIPFHQQDRLFYLHMQPEFFNQYIFLGFRAGPGMTDYQLQQWVEESIIACDEKIELVTTKRVTGASRKPLDEQEAPDLIPHSGTALYKIDSHDEFVKIKQNLNIFNAGDTPEKRPLDITLYLRQSEQ
jgi:predicted component of type VI protein secretion system